MGKIYKNQTNFRLELTTSVIITEALEKKIKYVKPDGTTGSLDAVVKDATNGIIYYNFSAGDGILDQSGTWKFYAYIKFSDSRIARGETVEIYVYN